MEKINRSTTSVGHSEGRIEGSTGLTDVLIRACAQTLEQHRTYLDSCESMRTVTLTVKLTSDLEARVVLFAPQSESEIHSPPQKNFNFSP